ncbi:hypothetical protein ACFC0D_27975 [Streptomyces sp. NPDC056222]|uniref:hypothetical protein n=1 Tax=Streptomyces sp. NPDC056222 TaxID=3345749 RepID=UPI0035E1AFFF
MTTWVPDSCTLPTAERPLRVAEFDSLFTRHLMKVSRPDRLTLEMVFGGEPVVDEAVRDLVARESGCCSFFTFTVSPCPEGIRLDVAVDMAHEGVLDALQRRGATATRRDDS